MSSDVLVIKLAKSSAVYAPGEIIVGEVCVKLKRKTTLRGIRLRVTGEARVHFRKYQYAYNEYEGVENYFDKQCYVVGGPDEEIPLDAGHHSFLLTFALPVNIPNTVDHKYGRVGYNFQAIMEKPWAKMKQHTCRSTFILLQISADRHPPCISAGYMEAQIRITRRVYKIGDQLEALIYPEISSKSVKIMKIELRLKQILEFHAGGKTKSLSEIVQWTGRKGPFRNKNRVKMGFQVPEVLPSGLQHCGIIRIKHRITVKFMVSGCHCDTKKEYEIKIEAKSSLIASTSERPSTPPLPVPKFMLDSAALERTTRPPSYNPLTYMGLTIGSPTATLIFTSTTERSPPSYEFIMAQESRMGNPPEPKMNNNSHAFNI